MAVVESVVIGNAKNKLGELVFTTIKGRTIARKYQANVRNPNTVKQVDQRNRLANCIQLYQELASAVSVGFSNRDKYWSVYNAFIAHNIAIMDIIRYETIDGIIEDASGPIIISTGNLGAPVVSYVGTSAIIDFSDVKDKFEVGDQVKLFGLNRSGKTALTLDHSLTSANITSGVLNIPFALSNVNQQYKFGAIMYKKGKRSSSNALLLDWMELENDEQDI